MSTTQHQIRRGQVERKTGETVIRLSLDLDGTGTSDCQTGVLFLDHMLDALARHANIDLSVHCAGDAAMDPHHTVEDVGICCGQAMRQAIGTRAGIARFGHAYAPLDEALARVVLDFSGRPFLHFEAMMPEPVIGTDFASSLIEEFWRSVAIHAALTMHIELLRARNAHHAAEAIFKAAALAVQAATRLTGDPQRVPSTKGMLA